jgi:hypothetical protein
MEQPAERHVQGQPRTQDLSLGKTLAAAGHVPCPKFSGRGAVVKVSNYMLQVGYYMYVYKPLKHKFCELLTSKYLLIFVYFLCFEFTRTFLHFY